MPATQSLDQLIALKASEFADQVTKVAAVADKEEEIRIAVEKQLAFIQKEAGIELHSKHEFTVAKGRVDSVYSRVLIEYKNPSDPGARIGPKLESAGSKKVVEQIKNRFRGMKDEHGHPLHSLFGVGLDGKHFIFVRFRDNNWQIQEPVEVNRHSAERFLWALFNLGQKGKPFSPEYLAGDFGANETSIAIPGVHALYEAIVATDHPKAQTFFKQWKILFGEVCGYDVDNPSDKIKKLAQSYGLALKGLKPAQLLFALHSYYALFMKLLAAEVVAFFHRGLLTSVVQKLLQAGTSQKLKRELEDLEEGSIFRHLNITNFLEGDLFAWYTSVWTEPIEKLVRAMVTKLDEYNPGTLSEDPTSSRDLLKRLYQQLFPKSVRHDLGEYYTPDWLADHVLNELGYEGDPDKRLLDPACGSGTFLVMAINHIKKWYEDNRDRCSYDEGDLCRKILANVIGFDLNPLAVMAARTNYLIAIRDLISRADKVEIPIYLCDSILTPSEYGLFAGTSLGKAKELKTAAASFLIPTEIATNREDVAKYALELEHCIRGAYSADEFLARCRDEGLSIDSDDVHTVLYNELVELDRANKNGVWARIIKNAFAPLFVGRFDYVAGNPPWISWDNLPEEYRNQTKQLWIAHGLFTLKGTAGRLGGGKKDLSMLFVYECLKSYLMPRGRLGYVITQSLFKTEGAGDGFRRFEIVQGRDGSNEPFRVTRVDDLSTLKPFEGAANRTSVLCVVKGIKTAFPLDYTLWLPKNSAVIDQAEELPSVRQITRRIRLQAVPVYGDKARSPWLTVCRPILEPIQRVVGTSFYQAQAGATTCGGDGVFLVRSLKRISAKVQLIENIHDAGKRTIPHHRGQVQDKYLFPVCRGKDISRWQARNEVLVLMLQDPQRRVGIAEQVLKKHRETWDFIRNFKQELLARRSSMLPKSPFYSIYGVDDNTFAPYKVVWGRVSNTVSAAVLGRVSSQFGKKPVLPFEAMMIPFVHEGEAHFVCGCLNSVHAQMVVIGSIVLHPDTHVMRRVSVPQYDARNPLHLEISALSKECHQARAVEDVLGLRRLVAKLDTTCGQIWGISGRQTKMIRDCLHQIQGPG
jgi:hypothetical protein